MFSFPKYGFTLGVLFAIQASLAVAQDQPQVPSDQVPDKSLVAVFMVVAEPTNNVAVGDVVLYHEVPDGNGGNKVEELKLAPSEKVTFYFQGKPFPYLASQSEVISLPQSFGGEYEVEYVRFNGHVFRSKAVMPEQIRITDPANGSHFKISDPITFRWNYFESPIEMTEMMTSGCHQTGVNFQSDKGVAVVPAGFVENCGKDTLFEFFTVNANMGPAPQGLQMALSTNSGAYVSGYYDGKTPSPTTSTDRDALAKRIHSKIRKDSIQKMLQKLGVSSKAN